MMSRSLGLALVVVLASAAAPVRADMPAGPWPWSKGGCPRPNRYLENPPAEQMAASPAPRPEPAKRTGPFRSCGSGASTGLAGIGLAWGALWLGNRFVGRVRGAKN